MTVTGRDYTSTRPRGLVAWQPRRATLELLDQITEVLDAYREHLPLTARQVFYVLVGRFGYSKTERAYERLTETLNRARRAGRIDWASIRDDGTTAVRPNMFGNIATFWATVRRAAESYTPDLLAGQDVAVEVWVEAAGMVPQAARVAHSCGVPVFSAGGFDSVTGKHEAALRFLARDRATVVLHVGDHDPSGCAIIDSAAADIDAFTADYGEPGIVAWDRVAVVPEQIDRYQLTTAPQKPADRRGTTMRETVQCEALAPDQLAAELRRALEDVIDLDQLAAVRARGDQDRAEILAVLDDLEEPR